MNTLRILCSSALAISLAACSPGGGPVGLTALNLRQAEQTPCVTLEGKKYLGLAFNYSGTLETVRLTFTPYVASGTSTPQAVLVGDVTNPPSSFVRVLLNESTVAKVYVNLQDAVLASQGVTAPDPKQTRPMNVRLEVSNKAGQKPGALELRDVDVSGCY